MKNQGGMAFPLSIDGSNGMSMRQYYKAAALTGLISCLGREVMLGLIKDPDIESYKIGLLDAAGRIADAAVKEDEASLK
jgi:hypothetical protein